MDEVSQIAALKRVLLSEVSQFCSRDMRRWKRPVIATLSEIREQKWASVFFGGTLRSLLMSRIKNNVPGKPRDIDIVMRDTTIEELRDSFGPYISRETRFGGLQLRRVNWQFDVWPLEQTYALKEDAVHSPEFEHLPYTTFLNVEAIAVEVWPRKGHGRKIFSGDDQFFRGVLNETIELNREANPFPKLCVVRGVVMAANLGWKVGPRLLKYIAIHGRGMSRSDFDDIQRKHYGRIQWDSSLFVGAMDFVRTNVEQSTGRAAYLPLPIQSTFWPEEDGFMQRVHLRILRRDRRKGANSLQFVHTHDGV